MGKLFCNGVTLNYRTVGEGKDVVLIHGLAANHAFWRFDVLLALAKEYRVTVYDLRGHGLSGMPETGYTSADMASDLLCLLDELGIGETHLVGHSFGGVVALHFAAMHPERVSSITVADSRVRALQKNQRLIDWPNWKLAQKRFAEMGIEIPEHLNDVGLYLLERTAQLRLQHKRVQYVTLFNELGRSMQAAERWLRLLHTTTAREDLTSVAGLTEEVLAKIRRPALAIYGEKSTLHQSMNGLRDLLNSCKTVIVPDAGHFFPLHRPRIFVAKLKGFLASVDAAEYIVLENMLSARAK